MTEGNNIKADNSTLSLGEYENTSVTFVFLSVSFQKKNKLSMLPLFNRDKIFENLLKEGWLCHVRKHDNRQAWSAAWRYLGFAGMRCGPCHSHSHDTTIILNNIRRYDH